MPVTCSLLDYLALKLDLAYLSDLRYEAVDPERLEHALLSIPSGWFTAREWQEACAYIAGAKAENADAARKALLRFCMGRSGSGCRENREQQGAVVKRHSL